MRRCVPHILSPTPLPLIRLLAKPQPAEEQHQLPPLENVPQDRGPAQTELAVTCASLCTLCIPTQRRMHETASCKELESLLGPDWRYLDMVLVHGRHKIGSEDVRMRNDDRWKRQTSVHRAS
jgi:hypothetical protein